MGAKSIAPGLRAHMILRSMRMAMSFSQHQTISS